ASRNRPLQLAIIGSGPAGFYSAYRLLKQLPDARVDMYEGLPSPYGLVRFGIAPDHPEAKKCAETLPDVAKYPGFSYVGNVPVGDAPLHLPLSSIAPHYDAVLFAYGASKDKKLGVPGEHLQGVHSARAFVGWYNGLPQYAHLNPDLQSGDTAIVLGQGNVALDLTRILLMPLEELRKTDISEHAVEVLSKSKIRDVKIIGRRGPLQAPYTIKELRELTKLQDVGFVPPPEGWDELIQIERKKLPRQLRRIVEVLEKGSQTPIEKASKAWQLGYLRFPVEFMANKKNGPDLAAVGFEQMEYVRPLNEYLTGDPQQSLYALRAAKVKATGQKSMITGTLAFRSIGYESEALPGMDAIGVPFDTKKGIIPNDRYGRILSPDRGPGDLTAGHVPGMYCAGWVKRGPTGVIASTLDDAFTTADVIVKDWKDGVPFNEGGDWSRKAGLEEVKKTIAERGIRSVSWQDWERIDAEELRRGKEKGKEREKCRSVQDMLQIL
ncbi:uncharacterized protein MYCFIDRAFT_98106, partial [Pseudocercospora fijiensis CIRAD86]